MESRFIEQSSVMYTLNRCCRPDSYNLANRETADDFDGLFSSRLQRSMQHGYGETKRI